MRDDTAPSTVRGGERTGLHPSQTGVAPSRRNDTTLKATRIGAVFEKLHRVQPQSLKQEVI